MPKSIALYDAALRSVTPLVAKLREDGWQPAVVVHSNIGVSIEIVFPVIAKLAEEKK